MSNDFGVTAGHVEYSNIRFLDQTRHMVIFQADTYFTELEPFHYERPVCDPACSHRARLYLTDAGYKTIRKMEAEGRLTILHHANVINGYLVDDRKPKRKQPKGKN